MDYKHLEDIPPDIITLIGGIFGAVYSNELPFNVQNAIGNWLQLVGQAILTYNAQQQLIENGEGKIYGKENSVKKNTSEDIEVLKTRIKALENEIKEMKKLLNH